LKVLAVALSVMLPVLAGGVSGPDGFGLAGLSNGSLGEAGASHRAEWVNRTVGSVVTGGSPAPGGPFRGVLNYVSRRVAGEGITGRSSWHHWNAGTGEWDRDFLQYWDVESGTLYEVPMGPTIAGCAGTPLSYGSYVEFDVLNWSGSQTILRVPWGDDAYPHLVSTEAGYQPYGGSGPFMGGLLHLSHSGDRLRVATPSGEAFYATRSDADPSTPPVTGLFRSDAGTADAGSADESMWSPVAEFDGSDGRHYGISVIYAEPACTAEDSYIVAADTGEVVACGWRHGGGPRLTEPEGSQRRSEVLALPQATADMDCEAPLDLRDLAVPDRSATAEPPLAGVHDSRVSAPEDASTEMS